MLSIRLTIALEFRRTGAFETSWFQALWSAAEGAVAGPLKAGKTWQPPIVGGLAPAKAGSGACQRGARGERCQRRVPSPSPHASVIVANGKEREGRGGTPLGATRMIVDCAHYKDRRRAHEGTLDFDRISECLASGEGFVWLGLKEPDADELSKAARAFDLPALAVEDVAHAHQRPKLEEYDGRFFLVLRTAWYDEEKEEVHFGEIHVFIGTRYVVTVRHGEASSLKPARERLERESPELLDAGPASVAWAILDQVVDNYEPVVAGIEDDIEEVEEEVFRGTSAPTERIYYLKREVIEFHRAVAPLQPPLEGLERGAFPQIDRRLRGFFRDVADHVRRVDEQVMAQRELLTSILEANLSLVSVRQNEVVKAVSAWAAIFGVIAVMTGIWGMNFDHMPELRLTFGYPAALASMVIVVLVLHRFFKRIGWL